MALQPKLSADPTATNGQGEDVAGFIAEVGKKPCLAEKMDILMNENLTIPQGV